MPEEQPNNAIISDTSCLIALANIDKLHLLQKIYYNIFITPEVAKEYKKDLPNWIFVKDVKHKELTAKILKSGLHEGESSSIALAIETKNSTLIIDEKQARNHALKLGLNITGTVSIIAKAYDKGFIDNYDSVYNELRKTNFRFSQETQDKAIINLSLDSNKLIKHKSRHR